MLIATDLDATTIYPAVPTIRANRAMMVVEGTAKKPQSVMTRRAARLWRKLSGLGLLLPATGRTNDQYSRLKMPGTLTKFAVTLLGAEILVDGKIDLRWRDAYRRRVSRESIELERVVAAVRRFEAGGSVAAVYVASNAYCVAILSSGADSDAVASELDGWARAHGWKTVREGADLYLLPLALDKQNAVAHLASSSQISRVLAGGDSLLDMRMLREAHACILPAHGSLYESNWACETSTVTVASSVLAADEILTWYADQAGVQLR